MSADRQRELDGMAPSMAESTRPLPGSAHSGLLSHSTPDGARPEIRSAPTSESANES